MLQNLQIFFQTRNPLIAILPTCKKPTQDPFIDEYPNLHSDENQVGIEIQDIQDTDSGI